MRRDPVPLAIPDLSAFARLLAAELRGADGVPSHAALMGMLARAGGFRDYMHLRAVARAAAPLAAPADALPEAPSVAARRDRVVRLFDGEGRLTRWPTRRAEQVLCLWAIWARLPQGDLGTERAMTGHLAALHAFGDPALLRRDLVEAGLVARSRDGTEYTRLPRDPPPEVAAFLAALQP